MGDGEGDAVGDGEAPDRVSETPRTPQAPDGSDGTNETTLVWPSTRTRPRVLGGLSAEYSKIRHVGLLRSPRQPIWADAWPTAARPAG